MNRRIFIGKSSLTLASLPFLSSIIACSEDEEITPISTDKKIVIIGAGIAGLGAAHYFKQRGVDVVVIEAQEKVGGRLRTDRSLGIPFDEGASWIHGPKNNPITGLASDAGADTYVTDDDSVEIYDIDGSQYEDSKLDSEESKYDRLVDNIEGSIDTSFEEEFYNKHPEYKDNRLWTYMLSAYLEFDTGGDIGELSSLDFYDDEAFGGDDRIITNGYDMIAEYLAQDIDVQLNTQVSAIDYSGSTIQITTSQGEITADYVMCCVPLGVLKKDIIAFMPSLTAEISNAVQKLKMGAINKFLCVWETPFWNEDIQYIGYTPETKGKFNYFMNMKKFTIANGLMTFAFGNYSKLTENMSDTEVIQEIMSHLKSIYGEDIPEPTHMLRTKWASNEYSFGAYSFATNGARSSDFGSFENAINDQLFFAGEHTSREYRGTVHGAYLSGIREAKKIVSLIQR